ncbi:MAG: GAF domain-containing protein [Myxococcales bacterium]|nr:MAG: GAF domain-containing protein [Myxococcales bacterium]
MLGQGLDGLLGDLAGVILRAARGGELEEQPRLLGGVVRAGSTLDVIAHTRQGLLVVEVEPRLPGEGPRGSLLLQTRHAVMQLQAALTFRAYCQVVAAQIRSLTGYDRVMIYRFAEDHHGWVFAEDRRDDWEPYLDLHYPASDIPAQARALFLLNGVRLLPDRAYVPVPVEPALHPGTGEPLDMSHTFLRGASVMYTEYLANMGVQASLTLAIVRDGALWGLVACHHGTARHIPYEVRASCELLAQLVSLQIGERERREDAGHMARLERGYGALLARLATAPDMLAALSEPGPSLDELLEGTSAAIVTGGIVYALGATPPGPVAQAVARWVAEQPDDVVATGHLGALVPEARGHEGTAAGLLAFCLDRTSGDVVMWLRPEHVATVTWAGDPTKPVLSGPIGDRLTPRKSFEAWAQEVKGQSVPWRHAEIDAARRLRSALVSLVYQRNEELGRLNATLARSNQELDDFAYVASHDLKEPLRGIYNYATFLLEDAGPQLQPEDRQKLDSILRLARRMRALIDSLLHFSRVGRTEASGPVDLGEVVHEAIDDLDARIRATGAVVTVPRPLPTVVGDAAQLGEMFTNLMSNAIKYTAPGETPRLEVGHRHPGEDGYPEAAGGDLAVYVADEGIGIPAAQRDSVFQLFRRLHAPDAYGGGTGAGLTIVRKLIERLAPAEGDA